MKAGELLGYLEDHNPNPDYDLVVVCIDASGREMARRPFNGFEAGKDREFQIVIQLDE